MEADKLGLPTVSVTLFPQAIPVNNPKDAFIKKSFMKVAGAGMGLMMTRPLEQIRKRVGLPPMGGTGIPSPISPLVEPPNPLWEPRHHLTGYWFAPAPQTWSPPKALADFLEAGSLPVVISLGAMAISGDDALGVAKITLEAVDKAEVRAIIQGWDEPMKSLPVPPTVFHADSIPHDWLLARASGLVHHGGFGTTSSGFRAGIPSLVIPHIIDQFIWGQKVAEFGVDPQPISRSKLKPQMMAEALLQMKSADMRAKAKALGERIQMEDGMRLAINLINQKLSKLK